MKEETKYAINHSILAICAIIILFVFYSLIMDKQRLTTENKDLKEKVDKWDTLIEAYNICDEFRNTQNECLYVTRAIDYEKCYWQAQETIQNKIQGNITL